MRMLLQTALALTVLINPSYADVDRSIIKEQTPQLQTDLPGKNQYKTYTTTADSYKSLKTIEIPSVIPQRLLKIAGTVGIFYTTFQFTKASCMQLPEVGSSFLNVLAQQLANFPQNAEILQFRQLITMGQEFLSNIGKGCKNSKIVFVFKGVIGIVATIAFFKIAHYFANKRQKALDKKQKNKIIQKLQKQKNPVNLSAIPTAH